MKNVKSTYDEYVEGLSKKKREKFEQGYQKALISELVESIMIEDNLSTRRLAEAAGVSPTIIQQLKTGKKTNINLDTLEKVLDAIGYRMVFEPLESR